MYNLIMIHGYPPGIQASKQEAISGTKQAIKTKPAAFCTSIGCMQGQKSDFYFHCENKGL